ncbi:MAG: cyanophycin synthetase, partial [Anaerolineales bacterium]|nr:cyanophycin synthetase [Anaerolineales bacterium]
ALEVLERIAIEKRCEFVLVGKDVMFDKVNSSLDGQTIHIVNALQPSELNLQLPLLGEHQVENAAVAYTALKVSGIKLSEEAIQRGFFRVKWRARFEIARREPPVIFDSAHNTDSFRKLNQTLNEYFPGQKIYLIFGASEDKNILDMFEVMKPRIKKVMITRADHPRALEVEKIIELAQQAGVPYEAVEPVESAFERALENSANDGSIVLSAGSMFVTAEVMRAWDKINA